jgi:hypothetical protein
MTLPAVSESAEIYFQADGQINGESITVSNIPGITLNTGDTAKSNIALKSIALSGTITAATAGEAPDRVTIIVFLPGEDKNLVTASISRYYNGISWTVYIPAFSQETTVAFRALLNGSAEVSDLTPVKVSASSVSGINLEASDTITLSGSIGAVTVDNSSSHSYSVRWVEAYNQDGVFLGRLNSSDKFYDGTSDAWSINISKTNTDLKSTTSISFQVRISALTGYNLMRDIPEAAKDYTAGQSISGIELGDVNFTPVTISGSIGNVTVDDAYPDDWLSNVYYISAYNQDGEYLSPNIVGAQDGAWSIIFDASNLQNGEEVVIIVEFASGGSLPVKNIPYNGASISGIALGDITVTTRTISGTIANLPAETFIYDINVYS